MGEAGAVPSAAASATERTPHDLSGGTLASRIVLRRLAGIRRGTLRVRRTDGRVHVFGAPGGPAASIRVRNPTAFRRVLLDGETGAGVAYMRGEWEADDLVQAIQVIITNRQALGRGTRLARMLRAAGHALRANTERGARRNVARHYDLGNDFFELFLDPTMTYSSALFTERGQSLEDAQTAKYRRLARKARIGPEHDVLEIGCGWGGFAEFAAREIGCRVRAITISEAQASFARRRIAEAGLADRVEVELADYRRVQGTFDRIVSIEMLEAVGHAGLDAWFGACDRLLRPDGLVGIQVITIPDQRYDAYRRDADFIRRYVFPGGHLPSPGAISRAVARRTALQVEHVENLAPHYAETLRRWRRAFLARRDAVRALGFDEAFVRLWDYYLAYCEAAFASRVLSNLQIVLARPGSDGRGSWPYLETVG